MALSEADIALVHKLAESVDAARERFAQVFDQFALSRSGEDFIDFKLAALGLADPSQAYAAAFAAALERNWIVGLVTLAVEARLLAPSTLRLVAPRFTPQDATEAAAFQPEGLNEDMMPWVEMGTFTVGLLRGQRRVCEVLAGVAHGTGFLVGPQTVLTNWHVVQGLMNAADGKIEPGSGQRLKCRFDFLDGSSKSDDFVAVEDWLLQWSPMRLDELDTALTGTYADMTKHKPHSLDFAILRLQGAPGYARGWYALKEAAAVPKGKHEPLFVVQHPSQYAQRIGVTDKVTLAADGAEVQHQAPTAQGSSGGLCLDKDGKLVALHRGKRSRPDGSLESNLAVAAAAIAAIDATAAEAQRSDSVDPEYDIVWRLARSKHPVLGRKQTNRLLRRMLDPQTATPILIVRGPDLCGKSFTSRLVEERLGPIAPWLVGIAAAELPPDARDLALMILSRAGVAAAKRNALPKVDENATTDIAWIRDELFPSFRTLVSEAAQARDAAHGQLLWLVIDQLNKSSLPATGSRQFLDTLYQQIRTTPEIRVVLLGLDGGLPAGDPASAIEEILPDPTTMDATGLKDYIACLLTACKITPTSSEIGRLAQLVLHSVRVGGNPYGDQLVRLSQYLSGPLQRAADEWESRP